MSDFSDLGPQGSDFSDLGPQQSKMADLGPAQKQSTMQKVVNATGAPSRMIRGGLVGVENLAEGSGVQKAGERVQAAEKNDYVPEKGEKIAATASQFVDPRFIAMSAVGAGLVPEAVAASPYVKAAVGGAMGMAGDTAANEYGSTGKVNPKDVQKSAAVGFIAGPVFHAAFENVIGPLVEKGGSFFKWAMGNLGKPEMGPAVKAIEDLGQAGIDSKTIASEMAKSSIGAEQSFEKSSKSVMTPKGNPGLSEEPSGLPNSGFVDKYSKNYVYRNEKGDPVGVLTTFDKVKGDDKPFYTIAVHPEYQGKGIGSQLMKFASDKGVDFNSLRAGSQFTEQGAKLFNNFVTQAKNISTPIQTSEIHIEDKAGMGDPASQTAVMQKAFMNYLSSGSEPSSMAKKLFQRRYEDIGSGMLESDLFVKDLTRNLDPIQEQAIPLIRQGVLPDEEKFAAVYPNVKEILATAKAYMQMPDSPAQSNINMALKRLEPYYQDGWDMLHENYDEMGYHDHYVTQAWEKSTVRDNGPAPSSLSQKNPFAGKRYIEDYATGINDGKVPKNLSISYLLNLYDSYKIKTIANMRFRDGLENIYADGGVPVVLPQDEAPKDWRRPDSVFFFGKAVHPDVFDAVKAIIDRPFFWSKPGPEAHPIEKAGYMVGHHYEQVNSAINKIRLSASLMHYWNVGEASLALGVNPFKGGAKAAKMAFGDYLDKASETLTEKGLKGMKDFPSLLYKAFTEGGPALNDIPLTKRAISYGLDLTPTSDAQSVVVGRAFNEAEDFFKGAPIAKSIIKNTQLGQKLFDKSLFDYFIGGIKLQAFESHFADNLKAFDGKMSQEDIGRDTAKFINDATGGALKHVMISPRWRQAAHLALAFPDWAYTRVATISDVVKGGLEGTTGKDLGDIKTIASNVFDPSNPKAMFAKNPVQFQARKYWAKAAFGYFTGANVLNYINTQKYLGKGRMIMENPGERQKFGIFLKKDQSGEHYVYPGKPFSDAIEMYISPVKSLGSRIAYPIQMIAEIASGNRKTLSGYDIPKDQRNVKGFINRNLMVISFGSNQSPAGLPFGKGISKSQIIDMFQEGYENKDKELIAKAISWGNENGYNTPVLNNIAVRQYKQGLKKEILSR